MKSALTFIFSGMAMTIPFNALAKSFTYAQIFPADFENVSYKNLKKLNPPKGLFQLKKSSFSRLSAGYLKSPPIKAPFDFNELIISPSATLPPSSSICARARVSKDKKHWSHWYTTGKYISKGLSQSFKKQEDEFGFVDIDTIKIKRKARYIQYKIELESFSSMPVLKQLTLVFTDTTMKYNEKKAVEKSERFTALKLKVPKISQMKSQVKYSKNICSPVSIAMVLGFFDRHIPIVKIAKSVYDHENKIYGNWFLNSVFAGTMGLYSQIRRINSMQEAEFYIRRKIPIIASLTFARGKLKNSPIKETAGHLLVITGFDKKGNVIVNDPAAFKNSETEIVYDRRQFAAAWLKNKYGTSYIISNQPPEFAVIGKPVCKIYSRPRMRPENIETEALAGERVKLLSINGKWAKVELKGQLSRRNGKLQPFFGWIKTECLFTENLKTDHFLKKKKAKAIFQSGQETLSIGTRLKFITQNEAVMPDGRIVLLKTPADKSRKEKTVFPSGKRRNILNTLRMFLGDRYLWGGRSVFGIDCSGLAHLIYGINGICLPRNADDQFYFSKKVERKNLKPGDLVFSGKSGREINHVMIYVGDGEIIEAASEPMSVRKISFKDKFGIDFQKTRNGMKIGETKIYFGKVL